MKRDNNANNLYFSPPPPNVNVTFNSNSNRPVRQSLPIGQFLPPNQNDYQHRYSNNLETNHSNNAFAHLRYEISNLRSQFTKLIQKDSINEKTKEDKLNLSSNKRQDRVTAQSTIGFYNNQVQPKGEFKIENKGENTYFKNKLALNDRKNSIENGQTQKSKKEQGNRYHKKYSFQIQQKREQNVPIQVIDSTKIQELEVQIRKLGQLKHKSDQENTHLKKQLIRVQKELENKIYGLESQNQKFKNDIQQSKISLSLKNSLVQKLESENENFKKQIAASQAQKGRFQAEIQTYKNQIENIGVMQKNELGKIHIKYEQQIASLQLIHQNNINDILQRLRTCQENERTTQLALLQKQDQQRELKRQAQKYQAKIESQTTTIETLQNTIKELKIQQDQADKDYFALQIKYQESLLLQQNTPKPKEEIDPNRMKSIQDENNDLKKRVQSYKKTVQQLNSSNNSSRQKLMVCKQQSKKLKEQVKYISEQLQVKEKLITSLYRDINILDAQIRHNAHLKSVLSTNLRFIQDLNQKIIELECSRSNQKYKYINLQCIQQSS